MTHRNISILGRAMLVVTWIAVLAGLTVLFSRWYDQQYNPNQAVRGELTPAGGREVILTRNRYGHYVTNGKINGHTVVFMLDTGATDISVPAHIANRLGLKRGARMLFKTANGTVQGFATRLRTVSVGVIGLSNVRASINPHMQEDEVLLGMTFLTEIEFSQRRDQLILRQLP